MLSLLFLAIAPIVHHYPPVGPGKPAYTVTIVPSSTNIVKVMPAKRMPKDIADAINSSSGPRWFGIPKRWFDAGRLRCEQGHVCSAHTTNEISGMTCIICGSTVWLTFPEDQTKPQ